MNRKEAVMLCRYTQACCPQQRLDEYTPDAWLDVMGDLPYADCKTAVARVAKRQAFVAPSDIRLEVSHMHRDRIDEAILTGAPEDPADYIAWLKETRHAIATGRQADLPQIELDKHQVSADFIHELRARSRQEPPGKEIS